MKDLKTLVSDHYKIMYNGAFKILKKLWSIS